MGDLSVYLAQWAKLVAVVFVAAMSPGPDFVLAVKNALAGTRRAGLFTAFGLGLGCLVHVSYAIFGFSAIIASTPLVFNLIKYAGAAYLIYLGSQALRSRGVGQEAVDKALATEKNDFLSGKAALRAGFLTNLLNPKASLFFLAVFSQIIHADTPLAWQVAYGATCALVVGSWFCLVALVLTQPKIRNVFLKGAIWIDRVCGALLILLAINVVFSVHP